MVELLGSQVCLKQCSQNRPQLQPIRQAPQHALHPTQPALYCLARSASLPQSSTPRTACTCTA